MNVPFDRVVLMSPGELHLDNLGSTTPIELRTFGGTVPNLVWEQAVLPYAARHASLLFSEYNCPLVYPSRIVLANHGILASMPQTLTAWQRLRSTPLNKAGARRADHVIVNSQTTRSDLIQYFGVPPVKMDIVPPAAAAVFFAPKSAAEVSAEVVAALGTAAPYVLFVGKMSVRRHVPNLMEAFAIVRRELGLAHHLLIIGPNTSAVPVDELAQTHGITGVVRHLPYMEQTKLARIYAGADAFVLPSTYEGSSWTICEAMASGTAVIATQHGSLNESGGDAVLVLPTPTVDDVCRGLRTMLGDRAVRDDYARRGRARAQRFSIRACAEATMQILDRVAAPRD